MSESKNGEKNPNYGKHHSPETKRKIAEALSGENSFNWNGGTSFLPYSPLFNKVMRLYIRERDNYECQFCEMEENGQAHDVHHIDHEKKNDFETNLILLCRLCHMNETASPNDRLAWQEILEEKLQRTYLEMSWERYAELESYKQNLINQT